MSNSSGEKVVAEILDSLGVAYERERMFNGLTNKEKVQLPVDFAININNKLGIVEYNGPSHYSPETSSHIDVTRWKRAVANDNKRMTFCKKYKIPYLVIHYKNTDELDTIIEKFVNEMQNKRSGTVKLKLAKNTKAYFWGQNYAAYDFDVEIPEEVTLNETDTIDVTSSVYGFVEIGDDRIVWTRTAVNKLLNENKRLQTEIESYKRLVGTQVAELQRMTDELDEAIWANNEVELAGSIEPFSGIIQNGRTYTEAFKQYVVQLIRSGLSMYAVQKELSDTAPLLSIPTIKRFVENSELESK
jgi:hypothetical protein